MWELVVPVIFLGLFLVGIFCVVVWWDSYKS